jgi:hypothetical protein
MSSRQVAAAFFCFKMQKAASSFFWKTNGKQQVVCALQLPMLCGDLQKLVLIDGVD